MGRRRREGQQEAEIRRTHRLARRRAIKELRAQRNTAGRADDTTEGADRP
ncbi:hypothetical protein [Streptomyces sp. 5-6(2022)]|nr:hypothetical protein [Streptomyces sp. 5-6(2022)]